VVCEKLQLLCTPARLALYSLYKKKVGVAYSWNFFSLYIGIVNEPTFLQGFERTLHNIVVTISAEPIGSVLVTNYSKDSGSLLQHAGALL